MNIITGSGRSGTSFVASIFDQIVGLAGEYKWEESVRAGMESKDIVDLNKTLFFLNGKKFPYSIEWLSKNEAKKSAVAMQSVMNTIADNYTGKWVKDPLFSKTLQIWLDCHVNIEHVVMCIRNPYASTLSAIKSQRGFEPVPQFNEWQINAEMNARQGYLWDTITRYNIKYSIVRYEFMKKDLLAAIEKIFGKASVYEEAEKLISQQWNPNV